MRTQTTDEDTIQGRTSAPAGVSLENEFRDIALRIVVQRNDLLLPNLMDMLTVRKSINLSPLYQRRGRWELKKKSRLIESFLVNIPVPPVFLYETEFAIYEVMDGQQRLSTIHEFFNNEFALQGLEMLPKLNGLRLSELPPVIRAGLERRSLSAIVLLKESTPDEERSFILRQAVFERLNTGGVQLNAQEVRNCLQASPFNDLLHELASIPRFTAIWGIPPHEAREKAPPSGPLAKNKHYMQMGDNELVLRFFALLEKEHIKGGMKATLDKCMIRKKKATPAQLGQFRSAFTDSLNLCYEVYGPTTFRLPPKRNQKVGALSKSLYDAVMVAMYRNLHQSAAIRARSSQIVKATLDALNPASEFYAVVVGRPNTRKATIDRSSHMAQIIQSVLSSAD